MDSTIQSFLYELIFTNYLFFVLLFVLLYVIYMYFKIWPRIIVVRIFNNDRKSINIMDAEHYEVKCYINGAFKKISNNPFRLKKWYGIVDKCDLSVKIDTGKEASILKSEIKRMNRLNYFDFYLTKEESKEIQ